jgi:hypothetical protein
VDLAFLQHPIEVDELFRPGTRGARPSKEALLDNLYLDVHGITFCVHLAKGALEICQSILLRGDGTFPTIQLPISGKEMLLQLDGHR